jgi:hypothetical protein
MTDTAFIAAGWLGTAATVAAYAWQLRRRTRRAVARRTEDPR